MIDIWSQDGDCKGLLEHLQEHTEWFEYQFELRFESDVVADHLTEPVTSILGHGWATFTKYDARSKSTARLSYDRVMAERIEYLRLRRDPELPSQLVQ